VDFASLEPIPGGWSGETFVAQAAGERSVVRLYARPSHRGPNAHEVDAALLRLVRGLVPVADVLEVRRADEASGTPALLVTSYLPGVRGDLLLADLDEPGLTTLGTRLGEVLVTLAGIAMLQAGPFIDGRLTVGRFEGADGLEGWVEQHESALEWPVAELTGLRAVARRAQELLDGVGRVCLVHSDFNPKNLLVDPGTLRVTGLVDWEFAHAGNPFTDVGNLVRFDRHPAFVEAVLAAYSSGRGGASSHSLDLARAADLWALIELAARRRENPVAARAHDLLRQISRTGDLHAAPVTDD
jgi:aminoglycoside phosphotransferase (APT) family kinase protein